MITGRYVDGDKADHVEVFANTVRTEATINREIADRISVFCAEGGYSAYCVLVSTGKSQPSRTVQYKLSKYGARSSKIVGDLCSIGAVILVELLDHSKSGYGEYALCALSLGTDIPDFVVPEVLTQRRSFIALGRNRTQQDIEFLARTLREQAELDGAPSIDETRLVSLVLSCGYFPVRLFDEHVSERVFMEVYLRYE